MADPLAQFDIKTLVPLTIGGWDVSFTNSSAAMLITVLCVMGVLYLAGQPKRTLLPNRFQMVTELLFCFVGGMLRQHVGKEGSPFFPYVVSLFLFILFGNLLGLFPFSFTFTSHIIVTFSLACIVFIGATLAGLIKHGFHFFKLFLPEGVPLYIAPLLIPVELISYLSRPISLGVRLFANMVAGHIMLKIFAGFAALLAATTILPAAILPVVVTIAVTGFEVLVAVLQAYVFTILTCIYLNDALNLH